MNYEYKYSLHSPSLLCPLSFLVICLFILLLLHLFLIVFSRSLRYFSFSVLVCFLFIFLLSSLLFILFFLLPLFYLSLFFFCFSCFLSFSSILSFFYIFPLQLPLLSILCLFFQSIYFPSPPSAFPSPPSPFPPRNIYSLTSPSSPSPLCHFFHLKKEGKERSSGNNFGQSFYIVIHNYAIVGLSVQLPNFQGSDNALLSSLVFCLFLLFLPIIYFSSKKYSLLK